MALRSDILRTMIEKNKNKNEYFSDESALPEPENKTYEYSP